MKKKFHCLKRPFFILVEPSTQTTDSELIYEKVHLREVKYLKSTKESLRRQILPLNYGIRKSRPVSFPSSIRPVLKIQWELLQGA